MPGAVSARSVRSASCEYSVQPSAAVSATNASSERADGSAALSYEAGRNNPRSYFDFERGRYT